MLAAQAAARVVVDAAFAPTRRGNQETLAMAALAEEAVEAVVVVERRLDRRGLSRLVQDLERSIRFSLVA